MTGLLRILVPTLGDAVAILGWAAFIALGRHAARTDRKAT